MERIKVGGQRNEIKRRIGYVRQILKVDRMKQAKLTTTLDEKRTSVDRR